MTLLDLLSTHTPTDDKERRDLLMMRDFARSLASPFSRRQEQAHFTGSAVVVDPTGTRTCLIHHGKLGRWLQPGGHAEEADGGDLLRTALREAAEETGLSVRPHPNAPLPLDVDAHRIPARRDEPEHLHLDVRFLVVAEEPSRLSPQVGETLAATWLSFDEAIARADEAPLRRLVEKARQLAS